MQKCLLVGAIAYSFIEKIYQAQVARSSHQNYDNILEKIIKEVLYQNDTQEILKQPQSTDQLIQAIYLIMTIIEDRIKEEKQYNLIEESSIYQLLLQKHFIAIINRVVSNNLCDQFINKVLGKILQFNDQLNVCRNIGVTVELERSSTQKNGELTQIDLQIIILNKLQQEIIEYKKIKYDYPEFLYLPTLIDLEQNIQSLLSTIFFKQGIIDNKWQKFINDSIIYYLNNSMFNLKDTQVYREAFKMIINIICNTKWGKKQEKNVEQLLTNLINNNNNFKSQVLENLEILELNQNLQNKMQMINNKIIIQQGYYITDTYIWLSYIIQLYLELQGWKFVSSNQLKIEKYCPINRNILLTIIKQFEKFGQNQFIDPVKAVEYLENKFGLLEYEIYLQLRTGKNTVQNLMGSQNIITIIDSQQYLENNKYCQQITKELDLLTLPNQEREIPSVLRIESITPVNYFSKCITIAISGFTSENEKKNVKWIGLNKDIQFNSQIIGLTFPSSTETQAILNGVTTFIKCIQGQIEAVRENSYTQAEEQANKAAVYFSQLFRQLFPTQIINLVCFSLGSVFTCRLIAEFDKISKYTNEILLNDVLIMGGAAECSKYNQLSLNSVGGRIINVYSKNDQILNQLLDGIIFKVGQALFAKLRSQPVGLSQILNDNGNILNYDLTYLIEGHTYYQEQYSEILRRVNFHNYYI